LDYSNPLKPFSTYLFKDQMMQRVSLFGYGKTTKALAKLCKDAVFYDDKCLKPFVDEKGFKVKPSADFDPRYSDLEFVSPGIAPSNELVKKAKNLQSEYDYFVDTTPLKIWISGTNGKTTTTQMMQHLLQDKKSEAGGNIGTPLAELDKNSSIWILETSSFTIHYTKKALPNIYVLLPINPDHLSWHGSMDEYVKAKLKPLENMQEGEVAIIPHKYKDIKTNAFVIPYKDEDDLANYFEIDKNKVNFSGAFLADALLAMAVDKILFDRVDYNKINSFKLDPHRQEELYDSKGRLWVNDTKATNIDASIAALKRYEALHVELILGGDDKGVDLSELFEYIKAKDIHIYSIGSNKEKIQKLSERYNIQCSTCRDLLDAIEKIDKNLKKDEVALLSPAASSLDEFTSYAQRGDIFKKRVSQI
jgi:UDP-N-acetylmuramoylalanine--D-glutamate ligase